MDSVCFLLLVLLNLSEIVCDDCQSYGYGTGERSYRCVANVIDHQAEIQIDIKTCRNDPVVKFQLKISDLNIDFETQVQASQDIAIPGMSLSNLAGLYLQINLEDNQSGMIKLKVMLVVKAIISAKIKLIEEDISNSDCSGFLKMWNSAGDSLKYGVTGGLSLLLLLSFIWCCYCCCCKNNKGQSAIILSRNSLPLFQSEIPYKTHTNL